MHLEGEREIERLDVNSGLPGLTCYSHRDESEGGEVEAGKDPGGGGNL